MWNRAFVISIWLALPSATLAQEPLSAIDWLSQSVQERPVVTPKPTLPTDALPPIIEELPETTEPAPIIEELDPDEGIQTSVIEVTPLADIQKDTVGLLPASVSGLPQDFWGMSEAETIIELITAQPTDSLPEILSLLYTILLAEVNAPIGAEDAGLLLARTDKLLELGALDQAQALLERAGPDQAEIFRRWFDVSLLTGREDYACAAMRAAPGFAPTMQARVFCLARGGDWNAAALTLATGETLGFLSTEQADLMARFLDPGLYEGAPDLPPPDPLTPLEFAMREAIAEPRPAGALPLAFVHADLRSSAAWRSQMEAAERLVRAQALNANSLIELYTARKPAASGGIWNRVAAIQAFDVALLSGNSTAIAEFLPPAYAAMQVIALEVPFARYYGDRLERIEFSGASAETAFKLALLSDAYETSVQKFMPASDLDNFLKGLALGRLEGQTPPGTLGQAIADAFLEPMPEGELSGLLEAGKLGEAILNAMLLLREEAFADPGDIRVALSTFRAVGLEQVARRIAIQLLVLERRG